MDARIFVEPQVGATYEQLLAAARTTEDAGFDAFFRSDHYVGWLGDGGPGPTDAWVSLAGLARETHRVRLGTLMTAATFRLPGPVAIAVAQVDAMSGGRIEMGIGTGWYEGEHRMYGIPFPSFSERFDRLEEQVDIIRGLWETPRGERFSYAGRHYQLEDSPALPKPVQSPRPPILIGGHGARRTPALAARHADEFNVPFGSTETCATQFERVRAACRERGRDPESVRYSAAVTICCGRDDAEVRRRTEAIRRDMSDMGTGGLAGSPAAIVDGLGGYAAAGAQRVYLQLVDLTDLDHIELLAAEVVPQLAAL